MPERVIDIFTILGRTIGVLSSSCSHCDTSDVTSISKQSKSRSTPRLGFELVAVHSHTGAESRQLHVSLVRRQEVHDKLSPSTATRVTGRQRWHPSSQPPPLAGIDLSRSPSAAASGSPGDGIPAADQTTVVFCLRAPFKPLALLLLWLHPALPSLPSSLPAAARASLAWQCNPRSTGPLSHSCRSPGIPSLMRRCHGWRLVRPHLRQFDP